jgi:hypothetical protein
MTTNVAESFNNVLKGVRALLLCVIIELTFYRTSDYFRDWGNSVVACDTRFSSKVEEILEKRRGKTHHHRTRILIYKLMSLRFDASADMHLLIAPETPSNSVNSGATKLHAHATSPNYTIFHAPM